MISAKIVADSKNEYGNRITTMEVVMPRFILAEFNTHRMFSRNSASSRAIPFEKMVKMVQENPFIPIAWQKDHKGMQGNEYLEEFKIPSVNAEWIRARDHAIEFANRLNKKNVTKQLANRLLEPFMYHKVLVTATEWENFFALRCPQYSANKNSNKITFRSRKDYCKHYSLNDDFTEIEWLLSNNGQAEIHMMALAEAMWDAYNESIPKELKAGEWHIPYGDNLVADVTKLSLDKNEQARLLGKDCRDLFIKIATARCARVSYTVVGEEEKERNALNAYEQDIKLHDKLAESGHWSPFEHCAQAMNKDEYISHINGNLKTSYMELEDLNDVEGVSIEAGVNKKLLGWSGNFRGFIQYRKTFKNENIV